MDLLKVHYSHCQDSFVKLLEPLIVYFRPYSCVYCTLKKIWVPFCHFSGCSLFLDSTQMPFFWLLIFITVIFDFQKLGKPKRQPSKSLEPKKISFKSLVCHMNFIFADNGLKKLQFVSYFWVPHTCQIS